MSTENLPWHQQANEPDFEYQVFKNYLEYGPARSYRQTALVYSRSRRTLTNWAKNGIGLKDLDVTKSGWLTTFIHQQSNLLKKRKWKNISSKSISHVWLSMLPKSCSGISIISKILPKTNV